MAKPNYAYEKRQRELEKKRKKAEKAARKSTGGPDHDGDEGQAPEAEAEGDAPAAPSEPAP